MSEKWYAVMNGKDDDDWGLGFTDRDEAEEMVYKNLDIYPDGYIAIISQGESPVCIGTIEVEDFDYDFRWWSTETIAKIVGDADAWDRIHVIECMEELCRRADVPAYDDSYESWEDPARKVQKVLGIELL